MEVEPDQSGKIRAANEFISYTTAFCKDGSIMFSVAFFVMMWYSILSHLVGFAAFVIQEIFPKAGLSYSRPGRDDRFKQGYQDTFFLLLSDAFEISLIVLVIYGLIHHIMALILVGVIFSTIIAFKGIFEVFTAKCHRKRTIRFNYYLIDLCKNILLWGVAICFVGLTIFLIQDRTASGGGFWSTILSLGA